MFTWAADLLSSIWTPFTPKDPENSLSLDDAYKILSEECTEIKDEATKAKEFNQNEPTDDGGLLSKTGTITNKSENVYTIDKVYKFTSMKQYDVGSQVSFNLISVRKDEVKVVNVNLLCKDWDGVDIAQSESSATWCNRIILTKVIGRNGRELVTSTTLPEVNWDNVNMEFRPIVGDWIELDVKCKLDEEVVDLGGEILEINRISPVRPHIKIGKITNWDEKSYTGIINTNTFFNRDSLSGGYLPRIGDKVVAEIVESEQNRCSWRATKIIPEYLSTEKSKLSNALSLDFLTEHEDLTISHVSLTFNKLKETQAFVVKLTNNSSKTLELNSVNFINASSQCRILWEIPENYQFTSGALLEIHCECTIKNAGSTKELLLFEFEHFNFGEWIEITTNMQRYNNQENYQHQHNSYQKNRIAPSNNQLVHGQRVSAPVRFIARRLPDFPVPQRLLAVANKHEFKNQILLEEELLLLKPCLNNDLCMQIYEDKFHTLLHLEEITNIIAMRNYDQPRACFIRNGEYLMLEIDNLSERRPSIILGDRIIAQDPDQVIKNDFEGVVHKVGAKHVFLKFSPLFQESYKGEDFSIRVLGNRATYRRMHQAVHLAVTNLRRDLLFTSKILEKEPQVLLKSLPKRKSLSPREILQKLEEYHNRKNNVNKQKSEDTIEWYNKKLNEYQKRAVENILLGVARPLPYIIFGPPGTGKTMTIIETILQIIRLIPESRLLVAAPSNSAADLIAMRIIDSGVIKPGDLVRLISYNYAIGENIPVKLVPYCATGSIARAGTGVEQTVCENGMILGCNSESLGRHRITVSTCGAAGLLYSMDFPKGHFTHIIVDEAGQAAEPEVLIPMAFLDVTSGQAILAGDPLQLGPVVLSRISSNYGLTESYLERLMNRFPYVRDPEGFPETGGYDPRLVTKLLYNYRALEPLLTLTSSLFYNDDLLPTLSSTDSEEAKLRESLREMLPTRSTGEVPSLVFHGVNGENYQTEDSPSWFNPHEAAQIFFYVNELHRLGVSMKDVGIITPYIKQVKEIRSLLTEAEFDIPKIGTVEEFQGQEFQIVLLSTVRSAYDLVGNDVQHSLGFVSSPRRLNVAISRAKTLLVIVGYPALLCKDVHWRRVFEYCLRHGAYTGCEFDC